MRLVWLIVCLKLTAGLNVLFHASVIGQSHISFLDTAVNVLAKYGHSVDMIFAVYNDMVDIRFTASIRRNYTYGYSEKHYWKNRTPHLANPFIKPPRPLIDLKGFDLLAIELCKIGINDGNLLEFIKEGHYDIGITNDYEPCGTILFKAAGVPVVASYVPTPLFFSQVVSAGLPMPTSVYGTTLYPEHDGSMYDKTFHLIRSAYFHYVWYPFILKSYDQASRAKFGHDFPSAEELERNIDIVFANSNEIIEQPRPISHKIKYIGGMGVKKAKPLSNQLVAILESSQKGVVLFSFGTQVRTTAIPVEIRKNFLEAFKHFPEYAFIWKYDNLTEDALDFGGAENVHRLEWLPQTDLLNHRVKLFISHMGMNSFLETSESGVPVLSIPLFIDQQHNSQNAAFLEMGLIVNRNEITVENLVKTLKKLLGERKYGQNAAKIAKLIRNKPEQPEEVFVKWIEFAANHPGLHKIFNLPGAEMGPFLYYSGDVIVFILLINFIVGITIFTIFAIFCLLLTVFADVDELIDPTDGQRNAYESIRKLKKCLDKVDRKRVQRVCEGKKGVERDKCVLMYTHQIMPTLKECVENTKSAARRVHTEL
ncbi:unnamed protein product [Caenorhabditis bovis]|uniref:glucuronosyltransferase n=1 Tax=Caenorhabditis bovis TaxID=2654633 RepID=A0A8S1F0J7_9PELO|nr:unnamed protein product [Caenorhabditis bovis]